MMPSPVSIIVPTYKEAENIPCLTERVFRALASAQIEGELIIVDDNSRDGTPEVVAGLETRYPVKLVTRTDERGLSSAVIRGFQEARHEILMCMDADLSHPPESVPDVLQPVASGAAEFSIGSRYVSGGSTEDDWGLLRRINSTGATLLALPLTRVRDPMAGFFCLTRKLWERAVSAGLDPIGYKIGLELLIKSRCSRVCEVPIRFADRLHGKSKLTFRQQVDYLRHLWRLYRFRWPFGIRVAGAVLLILPVILVSALCIS
jgi:dolichol-phosphate mannosyltransferase